MRVSIRTTTRTTPPIVECTAAFGELTAFWRGVDDPHPGQAVDVEVDADGPLVWDADVIRNPDGESEHGQTPRVMIEQVDGDSVVARLGEGLLLLEVAGVPPTGLPQESINLRPASFSLWPTGI